MGRVRITCDSCGQSWTVASSCSVYEQQAVESCPCPECGAYTLSCHEAGEFQTAAANPAPRRRAAAL